MVVRRTEKQIGILFSCEHRYKQQADYGVQENMCAFTSLEHKHWKEARVVFSTYRYASTFYVVFTVPIHATILGRHTLLGFVGPENIFFQITLCRRPAPNYTKKLVYCGSPLFGKEINSQYLSQFVQHMRYAGVEHFYFYDRNQSDITRLKERVQPYIAKGIASYYNFFPYSKVSRYQQDLQDKYKNGTHAYHQILAMEHCAWQSKHDAEWVWFGDLDEFVIHTNLTLMQRPLFFAKRLSHIAEAYSHTRAVHVIGTVYAADVRSNFRENPMDSYIYRSHYRTYRTGRKYAIRPRMLNLFYIHEPLFVSCRTEHTTQCYTDSQLTFAHLRASEGIKSEFNKVKVIVKDDTLVQLHKIEISANVTFKPPIPRVKKLRKKSEEAITYG
jgi:hypothetical protein